ncbi:MAG: ABC transporter substrate-binding protein [Deltaproteobacteria bacterium]|nr:ABC transporter substrate-binding protein [Deltaproteobacteria bacterium]
MKIHCESIDYKFELPKHPQRVISLVSAATETLFAMGCGDRVVGVSCYCARYVPDLKVPVVGDYLKIDENLFAELAPDLILITTGLQRNLGLELAKKGLPVYALPLPNSFYGLLENTVTMGALMNEMQEGRRLCHQMKTEAAKISNRNVGPRPSVYVELWFGRHMRTIGGLTYIDDLVTIAGGDPIFAERREGYFIPDLAEVESLRPDLFLLFSELEYPVVSKELMSERGWDRSLKLKIVASTVTRGQNLIQEGPSFLETAAWLQNQFFG